MNDLAGVNAGIGRPRARSDDAASIDEGSRTIDGAATAGATEARRAAGRIGVATNASATARSAASTRRERCEAGVKTHAVAPSQQVRGAECFVVERGGAPAAREHTRTILFDRGEK